MSKRSRIRIFPIMFFVLSISFLIDAIYLHYFIPWTDSESTHERTGTLVDINTIYHDNSTQYIDIRSRSTFTGQFPGPLAGANIPKIIHQTWDTEEIPELYHKWMKTWKMHNPEWQHWFWTLNNTRKFVKEEYPDFLTMFDLYPENIFRSDALRYLILYKYGGFYMDLDMEALKPLDNWTSGFNCIVSEETYEHPFVVREEDAPGNIVNGFIACRPDHPFMKLTVDLLEEFAGNYFGDYLYATGPFFLNAVLERYLKRLNKNYQVNPKTDDITIVPPKYFFPTYDPNESDIISGRCFPGKYQLLKEPAQITFKFKFKFIYQ